MLIRLFFLIFLLSGKLYALSDPQDVSLIRDAEIEEVLKSYLTPLFQAAGLNPKSLNLFIVNSKEVNAFAMGGGRVAITTGLILKAGSALQVIGVLAHETAHLAGNHVIRGMEAYEKALLQGLIGTLGGLAAGVAISPEAGMGILMGAQELAKQGFLQFSRTQEGSADQGAARYLDILGYSSRGLLEFMQILRHDDLLSEQHVDPYALTHPLKSERMEFFRAHLSQSPHSNGQLPEEFEKNFQRIKVKIAAFTLNVVETLSHLESKESSLLMRYGKAIAYSQNSQIKESLNEIDSLLKEYPNDPFFWDLKGQILFEAGKIQDAIQAYEKAVELRPNIPLLRVSLAHARIESNDSAQFDKALSDLLHATTEEPENPLAYRLLAIYYGKKGDIGRAALSLAEMALIVGDFKNAKQQAQRSLQLIKNNPNDKMRARDILKEVERLENSSSPF